MNKITNNPKVFIAGNQVCMKRGLDAERLQRYFLANHCTLANAPEEADIIIALTCAFIGSYVKTATRMIEKLKTHQARLIVLGCLPAMAPEELNAVFTGPMLSTRDFDRLDSLFPDFTVPLASIPDANFPDVQAMQSFDPEDSCPIYIRNSVSSGKRPGPFIRIAWGCRHHCSYCSHPEALGPLKSKPPATCVEEYQALLAAGHKHVILHANDPGAYGLDIGLTYPLLLQKLEEVTSDAAVLWTLNDIHPAHLVRYGDDLLPFIEKGRIVYLAVPMQSGSPAVLRRMRRYSRVDALISTLQRIHTANPAIRLGTHLIVGFPDETMEDLDMTFNVVRQCGYHRAMLFPFSANPGTPASLMKGQHSREAIMKRMKELADRLNAASIQTDVFS